MAQLHIHTGPEDEHLVPEIMQMIDGYRSDHRPMHQLVALHRLLTIANQALLKKPRKEKEEREEKKIRPTRS